MDEIQFKSPATVILSGCTCSGKTTFAKKLISNLNLFDVQPKKIIYFYAVYSRDFELFDDHVQFIEGLPLDFAQFSDNKTHTLIIIDDLQQEAANSKAVECLFTRDAHHRNMSVLFLTQNVFYQGKVMRTLALNAHVIVLFKNPRCNSQIQTLQQQLGIKHVLEAYNDVMKTPYSYLIIDVGPKSNPLFQMRTNVFPGEVPVIYQ